MTLSMHNLDLALVLMGTLCLVVPGACGKSEEEQTLEEKIQRADEKNQSSPVFRYPPPGTVRVEDHGKSFFTRKRTNHLDSFPCSECHGEQEPATGSGEWESRDRKAHWDIEMDHGTKSELECSDCHGAEKNNSLQNLRGKRTSFNRPDRVCSTCHDRETTDWIGGSHGKQYKKWKGRRIIYNCTSCHDPHKPSFPTRRPEKGPTVPRSSKDK